jgi:superfamily II DNA/RNA helicase
MKNIKKTLLSKALFSPEVLAPQKLEYLLDDDLAELFNETVVAISSELTYARYQAIANLIKKEHKDLYENAEKTAKNLAKIVKIQLVKRLESSFYAFKKSLEKFQLSNARMIAMFENDKIYIAPDLDINKLLDKGLSDEEINDEMADLEGDRNKVFTAADFEETFIEELKADDKTLTNLVTNWQAINDDPKLQTFLAALRDDLLDKAKNTEGKLVIFSESKDTVDYLAEALKNAGHQDILAINGQNRNANYDTIIANFDANLPIEQQKNDFNIILSTEVLAEGVNLHRANVVVNYDTPWNSTKLMQRIGRVNRIGSRSPFIYNFVFYPSAEGNAEIRLTQIALTKLQAFHSAYGEDNQVYSVSEILNPETLTTTAAIVEDKDERLEYLFELRRFLKKHPKEFARIKNLPLKSRTGRNSQVLNQPELSQSTISFIKDQRKINFYLVDKEKTIKELTEIEAFAIFKAKADESRTALIPTHHEQVQAALNRFAEDIVRQEVAKLPISQSVASKTARTLLSNWSASTALDNKHREKISQLITLVEQGKYANLATAINRFGSKTPSQQDIINKINEWTKMDCQDHSATSTNERQGRSEPQSLPNLILSESFE